MIDFDFLFLFVFVFLTVAVTVADTDVLTAAEFWVVAVILIGIICTALYAFA